MRPLHMQKISIIEFLSKGEELINPETFVRLIPVLKVPFRHYAKGIDCIDGKLNIRFDATEKDGVVAPDADKVWAGTVMQEEDWMYIQSILSELPELTFPVPKEVCKKFINEFLIAKDSPDWFPWILNGNHLKMDGIRRENIFRSETQHFHRALVDGVVIVVDQSYSRCLSLGSPGEVFISKEDAAIYLRRKGLARCTVEDGKTLDELITEPNIELPGAIFQHYYGIPQGLLTSSLDEYRQRLKQDIIYESIQRQTNSQSKEMNKEVIQNTADDEEESVVQTADISDDSINASIVSNENDKQPITEETRPIVTATNAQPTQDPTPTSMEADTLLSINKTAKLLSVSRGTIYNYIKDKTLIPPFPESYGTKGAKRFKNQDILDWARSRGQK